MSVNVVNSPVGSTHSFHTYSGLAKTGTLSGTMLFHHPHRDAGSYYRRDKALRDACCKSGYCARFLQQRIVNRCDGYENPSSGIIIIM